MHERRPPVGRRPKDLRNATINRRSRKQGDVVATWQLLDDGLPGGSIRTRVASGHMTTLGNGIHVVGSGITDRRQWWWYAQLAVRDGVLGMGVAAEVLRLQPWLERDVFVWTSTRRSVPSPRVPFANVPSFDVGRWSERRPDEVMVVGPHLITNVERTLFDLSGVRSKQAVVKCMNQAVYFHGPDALDRVPLLADRYAGLPGAHALGEAYLMYRSGNNGAESRGEDRLVARWIERGLPPVLTNWWIETPVMNLRLDVYLQDARLSIEIDGGPHSWRPKELVADPRKAAALELLDVETMRIPYEHTEDLAELDAAIDRCVVRMVERRGG